MPASVVVVALLLAAAQTSSPPPPFETLAREATEAREADRLEDAAALYQRGLAQKSDWDEGLWYLGSVLYELNRYADAREAFTRLLARQPDHAGAAGLKGLCEFETGSA